MTEDCKTKLIESIEKCCLPKLARGIDECEIHAEYEIRSNKLIQNAKQLIQLLGVVNFKSDQEIVHDILSRLVILHKELQSDGPWTTNTCKDIANKLNYSFDLHSGITLDKVLLNHEFFKVQTIFDLCMKRMHENITSDTLKKYPALVEAYCSVIKRIKEYNVVITPGKVLPISLLLIDDYTNENRMKGLQSCLSILECLRASDFSNGNYYEVIYASFTKVVFEKDLQVTRSVLKCNLQLIKILPPDIKVDKTDDFYANILEQLSIESNLHRKFVLLEALKAVIEMHRINCVKQKIFKTVICDNLDVCSNEAVAELLLKVVLECLEEWLKYCWCVWRLPSDQKILTTLLKTLYVCKEEHILKVHNLIVALIKLCTEEEQRQIIATFEEPNIQSEDFLKRIASIKKEIVV